MPRSLFFSLTPPTQATVESEMTNTGMDRKRGLQLVEDATLGGLETPLPPPTSLKRQRVPPSSSAAGGGAMDMLASKNMADIVQVRMYACVPSLLFFPASL